MTDVVTVAIPVRDGGSLLNEVLRAARAMQPFASEKNSRACGIRRRAIGRSARSSRTVAARPLGAMAANHSASSRRTGRGASGRGQ